MQNSVLRPTELHNMMLYKVRATKMDIVRGGSYRGLQQRYGYCVINNAQWLCRALVQQKLT